MARIYAPAVSTRAGRTVIVREPEHAPDGDPCARCGLPTRRHRSRPGREGRRTEARRAALLERPIVFVDGEGRDLSCPRCGENDRALAECPAGGGPCRREHVYTYLSAVDESGQKRGCLRRPSGLLGVDVLAFLLDLEEPRLFGYALGYDETMWLGDLPDERIYRLVRPELRNVKLRDGRTRRRREEWQGFEIDWLKRLLTIRRIERDAETKRVTRGPKVDVWDVFGFYQGSFVRSLTDWKTTSQKRIDEIDAMKRKRKDFAHLSTGQIEAYCDDECMLGAKLVRQLIDAHEEAELPLRSFYGAGSTATALLHRMGTKECRGTLPEEVQQAAQHAFFGGRFECSVVGPVEGLVWNYDISSAYPYQATSLPCLACGTWRRFTGREADVRAREGRLAVLRCRVRQSGPRSWGPLPWRCPPVGSTQREHGLLGGSILWPLRLDETWCWRDEYVAARDGAWPGVEALEAWIYETACVHSPFGLLPEIYRERCRIGKDGPGIVLKLGPNSVYGKTAQSIGAAPFRSWVWAGCITSGCRAQILQAIGSAADPQNVLMVATDGILSAERLSLPAPRETGTGDCTSDGVKKPLGGWEEKEVPSGVFVARPGIYWPLGHGFEKRVKARGISRSVLGGHTCPDHRRHVSAEAGTCEERDCERPLVTQSSLIEQHFAEHGWQVPYVIEGGIRFVGMKAGVRVGPDGVVRSDDYGAWRPYPIEVSFQPRPKRADVGRGGHLTTWARMPGPSAPYKQGLRCPEGEAMRLVEELLSEQPEGEHEFL